MAVFAVIAAAAVMTDPHSLTRCRPAVTGPIVDVHQHLYPDGAVLLSGRSNPFTHVVSPQRTSQARIEATLAEMRRRGVVRAIPSSHSFAVVVRAEAQAPREIRGGYQMSVPTATDLDEIRRQHAAGHLDLIGEMGIQYDGVRPDDPRMEPLWALAEELDLPVGLHTGPAGEAVAYARAAKYRMADSNALPTHVPAHTANATVRELRARAKRIAYAMVGGGVSNAGDLVWTDGDAAWRGGRGDYLRVWQRGRGGWKIVIDQLADVAA